MFLTYLSERDYDPRYWSFIFQFETIVNGVVVEASKRIESMTDDEAGSFFKNVFAGALNVNSGIAPAGWWDRVDAPPFAWFCRYLEIELPLMLAESRRIARERVTGEYVESSETIDREKVRRLAHLDATFQKFILGGGGPENAKNEENKNQDDTSWAPEDRSEGIQNDK